MSRRILELAGGEAGFGGGVGEVVEVVSVDFRNASAQEGADEEFEALEFGLDDDEAEVGFGVCVSGLLFHELNLYGWSSMSANALGAWERAMDLPTYPL